MALSIRVLYLEFTNPKSELSQLSLSELTERIAHLGPLNWALAAFFTFLAYFALAGYDRIALSYLNKKISWLFITLCSFTTYALSHSIGASVFSGAAIRFRAYSRKGLSASEVAVLVGFCSFTFALGAIVLAAFILVLRPELFFPLRHYFTDLFSMDVSLNGIRNFSYALGIFFFLLIFLYIFGSWKQLKPLKIGKKIQISYPRLKIVWQQLFVAPLEIIGAAGIIYAALPNDVSVDFLLVLGAFITSFSVGLLSNAPGSGLGVLEVIFITLMPEIDARDLFVALVVFRIFYLIIPLILSLIFVALFEIGQYKIRPRS